MKLIQLFAIPFLAIVLFSCGSTTSGEDAKTGDATDTATATADAKTYNADLAASTVSWEGTKFIGGGRHVGTISLKSGNLSIKDGNIQAGDFVLDMGSIVCTDKELDEKSKGSLVGHLASPDFFDVAKFPEAKFVIAEVAPLEGVEGMTHSIQGNLTMKDVTKSVTFNANVSAGENGVTATSNNFKIDRTEWGVEYGASSIVGIAKDDIINNDIGLQVVLVAK